MDRTHCNAPPPTKSLVDPILLVTSGGIHWISSNLFTSGPPSPHRGPGADIWWLLKQVQLAQLAVSILLEYFLVTARKRSLGQGNNIFSQASVIYSIRREGMGGRCYDVTSCSVMDS